MARVAINGLGRIGRAALKILMRTPELQCVAANDIAAGENLVYLLKYDTVYGRYPETVALDGDSLRIGQHCVRLFRERDPARLPWQALGVDIVLECTGALTRRDDLVRHIQAGAKVVILSAPAKSEDVATVVPGVRGMAREEEHT